MKSFIKNVPLLLAVLAPLVFAKKIHEPAPEITRFVIARHTFIDIGPPFNFYELFIGEATPKGTLVEKITLTPHGGSCLQPAKAEAVRAQIVETIPELFGSTNPCLIPEKELKREAKRCKKCTVFSGANVLMQVQCGGKSREIRANVLDRDMFDPNAQTPEHTSWTMRLLDRLAQATGPGVLDRPIFPTGEPHNEVVEASATLTDVGSGKFDTLFPTAPDRPSELYRASQLPIPEPDIKVTFSPPLHPESAPLPKYPAIGRIANVGGVVSVSFTVGSEGKPTAIAIQGGPPLLHAATLEAVSDWKFSKEAVSQEVKATIVFTPNCRNPIETHVY